MFVQPHQHSEGYKYRGHPFSVSENPCAMLIANSCKYQIATGNSGNYWIRLNCLCQSDHIFDAAPSNHNNNNERIVSSVDCRPTSILCPFAFAVMCSSEIQTNGRAE